MAFYKIIWKASAAKEVYNLPKSIIPRVFGAVAALAENPNPAGSRKLRGSKNNYRIRLGDYRIIYSVYKNMLIVEVVQVGHRKNIYDKFFR